MVNEIRPWKANYEVEQFESIPVAYSDIKMPNLPKVQRHQIIAAFEAGAYDMASEYAWKKTMVKLKEIIASLGHEFISEMLKKPDIDEYTQLTGVISDHEVIYLAENIGLITEEGAMLLRHSLEQLCYYFSSKAVENEQFLDKRHAESIILDCAKHVLCINVVTTDLSFTKAKNALTNSQLTDNDELYNLIVNSSLFYMRTVCNILLSALSSNKIAAMECAISNLNLLILPMWEKFSEDDKYNVGKCYRNVVADGNEFASKGLRKVLMKVKGFNYVPESLRSDTFIEAAQHLVSVHYDFDNFYNEPSAIKALSSLGTIIPEPALSSCIRAYLLVYMGNNYGVSIEASRIARDELLKISKEQWDSYLRHSLAFDEEILSNFEKQHQLDNLLEILKEKDLLEINDLPREVKALYNAIKSCDLNKTKQISRKMLSQLRPCNY